MLSHELRSPLTSILSWSALLREDRLDAAMTERALETIERNAKLQARIVEDLLDVSRAISGKLKMNVRPIAVDPVIHAAIDSVRLTAEARGVSLEARLDPQVGPISGDPERLQQVVWNLLSNAIKFTPRGGRVEVRLAQAGEHVHLTVSDNGDGINPAFLPRMFERFWQADSSTTRSQGGMGLGLAVVRHLVELHGGTVQAESEGRGLGATFTVTLPLLSPRSSVADVQTHKPAGDDLGSSAMAPRFQGLRVLVVDDDGDTCETVAAVLQRAGAEVRKCLSASEALAEMDTWLPDILVSDIGMPGEDGYTLIREIPSRARSGGRAVAVALTAYGSDGGPGEGAVGGLPDAHRKADRAE